MSKSDIRDYIIYKLKFPLRVDPYIYSMIAGITLLLVGLSNYNYYVVFLGILFFLLPLIKIAFQYDYDQWKRQQSEVNMK